MQYMLSYFKETGTVSLNFNGVNEVLNYILDVIEQKGINEITLRTPEKQVVFGYGKVCDYLISRLNAELSIEENNSF